MNACWIGAEIYRAVDTLFGEILKDFSCILLLKFVLLLSLYEFGTMGAPRDLLNLTTCVRPYRRSRAGFGRPQQIAAINTNNRVPTCSYRVVQKYGDGVLRGVPGAGSEPELTTTATRRGIPLGLMNCHSSRNKADLIADHIISHDLGLLALTEAWLKPAETIGDRDARIIGNLTPPGFSFQSVPRPGKKPGGGVGLVYRCGFKVAVEQIETCNTFEYMVAHISCGAQSRGTVVIIYRPPPAPTKAFFIEVAVLLDQYIRTPNLIVVGDFNVHIDDPENPGGTELLELLDSMALQQHVSEATHVGGHTLDLVISRDGCDTIRPGSVGTSDMVSDHSSVHCVLDLEPPAPVKRICTYRRLGAIDRAAFREDLQTLPILVDPEKDIGELVGQYCHDLAVVAEKHAPEKSRVLRVRPHVSWYTEEISQAKRTRRQYEDLCWRKSGLTVHRQMFTVQRQVIKDLILNSKRQFFASAIREAPCFRAPFSAVDKLLHRKKLTLLPEHTSTQHLANRFCNFFHKKIVDIRRHLDDIAVHSLPDIPVKPRQSDLTQFSPVTPEELLKIIRRSPAKSCALDPMPTSLLMEHIDVLLPAISNIVNLSLTSGVVPAQLKVAHVTPLLKKPSLNPEDLKNFRPVSNLHFLSKIVEKAVAAQLSKHLQENALHAAFASQCTGLPTTQKRPCVTL